MYPDISGQLHVVSLQELGALRLVLEASRNHSLIDYIPPRRAMLSAEHDTSRHVYPTITTFCILCCVQSNTTKRTGYKSTLTVRSFPICRLRYSRLFTQGSRRSLQNGPDYSLPM